MVKAKDLLDFICNCLEYRFFTGTPCVGLLPIYKHMNPANMYYIPASSENSAVNIACGMIMTGIKSTVMIPANKFYNVYGFIDSFVCKFNLPFLLIVDGKEEDIKLFNKLNIYSKYIGDDYEKDLKYVSNKSLKDKKPCVVIIDGDCLV